MAPTSPRDNTKRTELVTSVLNLQGRPGAILERENVKAFVEM